MKKRDIAIMVICLLLIAGLLLYLYRVEWIGAARRAGLFTPTTENSQAAGHQHGAPPSSEAKADPAQAVQAEEPPTVEIPTDKQQMIGVRTVKAAMRPMHRVIRTVGRIEYDEKKLATANTKIEGWIEKLHVDYVGRHVQKGEPLAEIFSPELVATQQEFLNTLRWANQGKGLTDERTAALLIKDAQTLLEAAKERLRLWDISDEQIRKIETTGKPIRTLTVYSPAGGYVLQKMAVQAYRAIDCAGMARVDFFLLPDGSVSLDEINTIPGFTRISMYPKLWAASGLSYPRLLDRLIELALARHKEKEHLATQFKPKSDWYR